MQYNTDTTQPLAPDEVSIKYVVKRFGNLRRYLASNWPVIGLAVVAGGALGIAYSLHSKPTYTAESTFVLADGNEGSNKRLAQYSALASMMGMDVGSSSGLFQSDNIIELYQSRLMVEKTLLSPASFNGKQELLIDRYIDFNKLRKGWNDNPKLKGISFDIPKAQFTRQHDSIMTNVVNDINANYLTVAKPDKKLSIISVKVKAHDELFAKNFTVGIVANVNSFYTQTKTKSSQQTVAMLQHQADSVRHQLNSLISGSAAEADYNPNPNPALQSLRVPGQRKQIDLQSSSAIYAEIVRNLAVAKNALQTSTPLIQPIDQPVLPLPKKRTGKLVGLLTGAFIAGLLSCLWLITNKVYKNLMS